MSSASSMRYARVVYVRVLSRKTAATCAATSAELTETPACFSIVEKASG